MFVGSSSIRMWKNLAKDFPDRAVINRGFGGSQIIDSVHFAERIVLPYAPRQVVMYAGGNDINGGKTPSRSWRTSRPSSPKSTPRCQRRASPSSRSRRIPRAGRRSNGCGGEPINRRLHPNRHAPGFHQCLPRDARPGRPAQPGYLPERSPAHERKRLRDLAGNRRPTSAKRAGGEWLISSTRRTGCPRRLNGRALAIHRRHRSVTEPRKAARAHCRRSQG